MANLDPQLKSIIDAITWWTWDRNNLTTVDTTTLVNAINETLAIAKTEIIQLWGKFLLDPNEINWFTEKWIYSEIYNRNYWTSQSTTINRKAWWVSFPYDVKLNKFHAWHMNSNWAAKAWWWVIWYQTKTAGSNSVTSTIIKNEVTDNWWVWPRNYLNVRNQLTSINLSWWAIIPAWSVIFLWVDAPTALTTNYYVQIESWYFEFERV